MAADMDRADELIALVRANQWLTALLETVEAADLPDAWIGAGAVRDLVWDTKFGTGFDPALVKDVDVAYFDPTDLSRQRDAAAAAVLASLRPGVTWDAKNQAAVHTWYPERFGVQVGPLASIKDAVASWPETATSVALRRRGQRMDVIAPFGLDDLLDGVWRRNPARITREESELRLSRKQPDTRCPGVRVIRG